MSFTDEQIEDLNNNLSPSAVAERSQSNRSFSYIEAWWAIAEANRIFGFDGWDRETVTLNLTQERDREFEGKTGWRVSYVAKVRVTVRAGDALVVREGTGAGHGIDKDLGQAHESATKEAESDAMKRALMQFGNPFGLALYDKTRSKVAPPRETKANSRGMYEALQNAVRSKTDAEELKEWGVTNADAIRSLPEDWADHIRDEYGDKMQELLNPQAGAE